MMYSKRLVFIAACLGMLLFGITVITLGSVVQGLIQKFHFDERTSGTLFSTLPFGVLLGSLFFGPFCDKYGYKYLLALSAFFIFVGFEGIAFAPSFSLLRVCVFLFGLGGGAINGATNALVADISEKEKGANLSLIGVFYGVGALGMPFVLGVLENVLNYQVIIAFVGGLALAVALFFLLIRFPLPKQRSGFPIARSLRLLKDKLLIFVAFFLFCASSFEGIINNWTTTYLINQTDMPPNRTLYALSLFVAGMVAMRMLMGSVWRNAKTKKLLAASFVLLLAACLLLHTHHAVQAVLGLILMGAGLAGSFPLMLGIVASRYQDLSGTAFSFVLAIALLGNTLVNYIMGLIVQAYGVQHLVSAALAEFVVMALLGGLILRSQGKVSGQ